MPISQPSQHSGPVKPHPFSTFLCLKLEGFPPANGLLRAYLRNMLEKKFHSLSKRQEFLEKVSFPLQEKLIACSNNCINSLKLYLTSKNSVTQATLLKSLDEWRTALDECERENLFK